MPVLKVTTQCSTQPAFCSAKGLLAPVAVPRGEIAKLYQEVARIVHLPEVKQRFVTDAADPVGSTPEQFAAHLKAEIERWSKMVRQAGIRAD